MAKKGRFRGARHAPKRLEGEFMAMAKTLSEDPGVLRPKCAGGCRKCHFDGTFSDIAKLERFKGSAEALNKVAQRDGDDIVKAYAGTISIYAAGTVPCLASVKLAGEDVPFILRGRVGNDKLIGMQYYDDPQKRLLLYNSLAKKKKLHLYSLNDELVCSDRPNMPKDYLLDLFYETPYDLGDDSVDCRHVSDGTLVIRILSLKEEVRICSDCAKDVSTLQYLISRLVAIDPLDDFEVSVEHRYHASKDGNADKITDDVLKQYAVGKITDRGILDLILRGKKKDLTSSGVSAYMIDKKHYGSDLNAFINDLKGTDKEKEVLKAYLSKNSKAVILKSDRMSEALSSLWKDGAKDILIIASSEEVVNKMGDLSKLFPSQAIEDAVVGQMSLSIAAKIPEMKRLGPIGKLADRFARSMKAGGAALLIKDIEFASLKDSCSKAVARAFILSSKIDHKFSWKWNSEEESLAQFLRPFVDRLISAEGKDYVDAMELLLTASGSGERV
ncbi:MAG: hypothetical protein LBV13_01495 [Methanomassiliicoccaceae archaeon]|jgi:hypothetical protein|nr:hypothetical protein [Methanomassiliicoccaceae archaeon]